ncbi:unnamed protein product [Blepharisma stoltei]|uniref:Uncharacterized protein n=1 Tax=Blepharisma stoltei TaxID=1481888 RepID=A0AAU9JSC7_9CILI|nr:unnamed protein product [Blepharisma stoltei]
MLKLTHSNYRNSLWYHSKRIFKARCQLEHKEFLIATLSIIINNNYFSHLNPTATKALKTLWDAFCKFNYITD